MNVRPLVALLLAALLAGCNSDSRQLLQQAEARWREGSYDDAIRLNGLLYDRDRQGRYAAQALLNLGNIYYLNLRQIDNAIATYRKLVEEFPGRPEEAAARLQLAAIYANEIGDQTQAIAEYDKLLEAKEVENRLEIEFNRANACFSIGEIDRALRDLRHIEDAGVQGELADRVMLKIGNIYQIERKYAEAAAYFQKVATAPCLECRRRALTHLTETYEALYDYDRAIETIRKLDRTPENEGRIMREVARLSERQAQLYGAPPAGTAKVRHR